jgi:hypothetical protein
MNSVQALRHSRMIARYLLPHCYSNSSNAANAASGVGATCHTAAATVSANNRPPETVNSNVNGSATTSP